MSSPASPAEITKNIVVLLLGGIAVVLGLVALVYVLMVLLDRYCSGDLEPGDVHQIDHGPVARKAGLFGLRRDERRVILERILIEKPYKPEMLKTRDSEDTETEMENPPPKDDKLLETDKETRDDEPKDETLPDEEANDETVLANMGELDDTQHDNTCAICLCDFMPGEMVVSGTSCFHIFHRTCAFEWLEKHDHCPYCRKEMMTPSEMRSTADEVLGEERTRILHMRMWDDDSMRQVNATPATEMTAGTV
jgi:hypothetical protein